VCGVAACEEVEGACAAMSELWSSAPAAGGCVQAEGARADDNPPAVHAWGRMGLAARMGTGVQRCVRLLPLLQPPVVHGHGTSMALPHPCIACVGFG
jgi:hypothetical protein